MQFLPALTSGTAVCANALLEEPLVTYVGDWGCEVIINLNYAHILSQVLGSGGMAMYRMITYRFTHRLSECKTIRNVILGVELITFLGLFGHSWAVRSMTNFSPFKDFCLGRDSELSQIALGYSGTPQETLNLGKTLKTHRLIFLQVVMLTELVCYIILYSWKYQDTGSEENKKLSCRRKRLNTITLTGQSASFAVEIAYSILHAQLVLMKDSGWEFASLYYLMAYGVSAWTLMTWSQILASTDMRRCFFDFFF